jgi:uncharacterized protein (TIGR02145 family)
MKTIILNGLEWDTENLVIDGKTHFTYEEAKAEAAKLGKRLPTKNEFDALLQLHHVFDKEKHGMWFAKNQADLKSDKSLFLPAAGFTYFTLNSIKKIRDNGCYWSDTLYKHIEFYGLSFSNLNSAVVYMYDQNYSYTVRCVTNLKQEIMETNQEIEFKIPEGYAIDSVKSTKTKIVCKQIETKYPKSWNEAFISEVIKGYYVEGSSIEHTGHNKCTIEDRCTFKTKKQAASSLAYAQLTQLMALPCYNGDWTPNWDDPNQEKYCITRMKYDIAKLDFSGYFSFLAFKSSKIRDIFFNNHMDLIKQFHQL